MVGCELEVFLSWDCVEEIGVGGDVWVVDVVWGVWCEVCGECEGCGVFWGCGWVWSGCVWCVVSGVWL